MRGNPEYYFRRNTDDGGQAMGEDLRCVQIMGSLCWSKHTGEGNEQQP